jgi:short-subunit dehydrogenase
MAKEAEVSTLRGEVALVTGASSGIGAATALELAQRGVRLVLAARRAEELTAVAHTIQTGGGEVIAVPTDVTDARQVARLVQRAVEAFGRVDVLVNNAGIGSRESLVKTSPDEVTQIVGVNLLGAMLLTRAVLPGMVERRHGAIISVASVSGLIATDPLYSATKFGLRGFSLGLRRELLGTGVSVSLVSPGFIRTPLTARRRARMPGPEIVARAIAGLVLHPRREVVVPRRYRFAVWAERALPSLADRAISGRRRD